MWYTIPFFYKGVEMMRKLLRVLVTALCVFALPSVAMARQGRSDSDGSAFLLFCGVGAFGLVAGLVLWSLAKFLSRPLVVLVPFFVALPVAGVGALLPLSDDMFKMLLIFGTLLAALKMQLFLLVASIAKLESRVNHLSQKAGVAVPLEGDFTT
jgi:hypothetical protein